MGSMMIRKPLMMSFLYLCTKLLAFLDTKKHERKHSESPTPSQAEKGMPSPDTDSLPNAVMETSGFLP